MVLDLCSSIISYTLLTRNTIHTRGRTGLPSRLSSYSFLCLLTCHVRLVLFRQAGCVGLLNSNRRCSCGEEVRFHRLPEAMQEAGIAFTEHGNHRMMAPECLLLDHQRSLVPELRLIHEPSFVRKPSPILENHASQRGLRVLPPIR